MNEKISKVLYQLIDSKDKIIAPKAIQQWKTELSLHLDVNDSVKKNSKFVLSISILQYNGYTMNSL